MFKTIVNKLLMSLYFVIGTMILELVTFYMLDMGFAPEYFWFNFAIVICVAFLVFIIPNYTAQFVVYTILLTLQLVLIYVNYSLLIIYGDLFSFDMLRLMKEAGAAITTSFVYFTVFMQLVGAFLGIVIIGYLLLKYCRRFKINKKVHFSVFSVVIILSLQCISFGYYLNVRNKIMHIEMNAEQSLINNDKVLMQTSLLKYASYKKFGTYGYFTNMIVDLFGEDDKSSQQLAIDYFNEGKIYDGSESKVWGVDKGNNVIVIMMESLEWFGFGDGTYDRELNNLSYELAPNIYSIIYGEDYLTDAENKNVNNDSIIARGTFEKAKTNMSEGIAIMGNYPSGTYLESVVGDKKDSNILGYSMPNVLKGKGYETTYVHNNVMDYYDRDKTHKYLGFNNVIGTNNLRDENGKKVYGSGEPEWDEWIAEGEFVQNAINYIVPKQAVNNNTPFYTFYLNITSHGAYTPKDNKHDGDAIKYLDYVKYGPDDCTFNAEKNKWVLTNKENPSFTNWYSNVLENYGDKKSVVSQLEYYLCGVCGLDEAVGIIMNKLVEYGIDDETTMVLFSDHNAYYDSFSNDVKGLPENIMNIELNSVPMIISSPGVKDYNATTNDKYILNDRFCSAYDIVPTLFDLLGVKFNENFYVGQSLFSPCDYIYELNGETYEMTTYYSITGGNFSNHIMTNNFVDYNFVEGITQQHIDMFNSICNEKLRRLNYLEILNKSKLFTKLTNNTFE